MIASSRPLRLPRCELLAVRPLVVVNGCTAIERAAEGAAAKVVREGRASTEGEGHGGGIVVARAIDDGRGEDSVWEGMVSIEGTVVTRTVDDGLAEMADVTRAAAAAAKEEEAAAIAQATAVETSGLHVRCCCCCCCAPGWTCCGGGGGGDALCFDGGGGIGGGGLPLGAAQLLHLT